MLFYVVFILIIAICLGSIATIIGRKLSQLTLINTEVIPKERNLLRKRAIIEQRVHRAALGWSNRLMSLLSPIAVRVRDAFRRQVKKLMAIDRQFRNEKVLQPKQKENRAEKLRQEAAKLIETEKFGEAEKKLIEVLAFDELNEDVYRDLGDLYMEMRGWDRARDTYFFLTKLLVKKHCNQSVGDVKGVPVPRFEAFAVDCAAGAANHAAIAKQFANFGLACQEAGDYTSARSGFESAAAFEPGNPKHLDSLVEACIMEGDKEKAQGALDKLRASNPENKKIETLQGRIDALTDSDETMQEDASA